VPGFLCVKALRLSEVRSSSKRYVATLGNGMSELPPRMTIFGIYSRQGCTLGHWAVHGKNPRLDRTGGGNTRYNGGGGGG